MTRVRECRPVREEDSAVSPLDARLDSPPPAFSLVLGKGFLSPFRHLGRTGSVSASSFRPLQCPVQAGRAS